MPKTSPWNQRVDRLPASPRSRTIMTQIGLGAPVHAGFGHRYGIPVTIATKHSKRVRFHFRYWSQSDRVRYPMPRGLKLELPPDRHALIVDKDSCKLYELFDVDERGGRWYAGSGAVWNMRKNQRRPRGWTSADAAGLPILPGLARPSDIKKGSIDHALRFSVARSRKGFLWPASHTGSYSNDLRLPAMGTRIRLKRNVSLAGLGRQARMVAIALKRYGGILADNGAPLHFGGTPSPSWNEVDLSGLNRLTGADFEVVDPKAASGKLARVAGQG